MAPKVRIYVAAAIHGAPQAFIDEIQTLIVALEDKGYHVLRFMLDPHATPDEVVENDLDRGVGGCTFVLAVLDERSTGVGAEFALAKLDYGKPVLGVFHVRTSKLVMGLLGRWHTKEPSRYRIVQYGDIAHIVDILVPSFLANLDVPDVSQLSLSQVLEPTVPLET